MSSKLSPLLLSNLQQVLAEETGLDFTGRRQGDLERGLVPASRALGFEDARAFATWLLKPPLSSEQIAAISPYFTVGETYFLRHQLVFDTLQSQVLPALIEKRQNTPFQHLKLWSAGCATGEEPYSLAILLHQLIDDRSQWRQQILGTDINPNALAHARQATYSEWSFRSMPDQIRGQYFEETEAGRFKLLPEIQKNVEFSTLNLVKDVYPNAFDNTQGMDIIFCRNVLMYFTPDQAEQVIHRLAESLAPDGWLVLGAGEAPPSSYAGLEHVSFSDVSFYRKTGVRAVISTSPAADNAGARQMKTAPLPESKEAEAFSSPAEQRVQPEQLPEVGTIEAAEMIALLNIDAQESGQPEGEPLDVESLQALTRTYAGLGELEQALACCSRAIAIDEMNPTNHYLLAVIYTETRQHEIAADALRRVLYLDSAYVLAHIALGDLHRQQRQYARADRCWRNALRLLKDYPPDQTFPDSGGMTARGLAETLQHAGSNLLSHPPVV